jgi:toxin ParE1/3/4
MPQKTAEYRLAPEAERDLESIWFYTLEEWGLEQANRYIDNFTSAFASLVNNPKHGTTCDHVRKGYRRSKAGRHMIYFQITPYGIAIIRVLHDRMQPTRHF